MSDNVKVETTPERIDAECAVCRMGANFPNKGMGRAMVAVFKTQHQHPEVTR